MKQLPAKVDGGLNSQGPSTVGSTSTCPPSPPATSNQLCEAPDLRSVPLSCVPPQNRAGICGTVAIDVNWAICRSLRALTRPVRRPTVPFRFVQSAALSGSEVPPVRPPRSGLYHTPPSLPSSTCAVLLGSNAN